MFTNSFSAPDDRGSILVAIARSVDVVNASVGRKTSVGHDCPKLVCTCCVIETWLNGDWPKKLLATREEFVAVVSVGAMRRLA